MFSAHHGSGSSVSPAFPLLPILSSLTTPNSTLISFHPRITKPLTSTRPRRPPPPTAAAPDPDLMNSQETLHGSEENLHFCSSDLKAEGSQAARSPPPPVKSELWLWSNKCITNYIAVPQPIQENFRHNSAPNSQWNPHAMIQHQVHFGDGSNDAHKVPSTSQQKISIRNYFGENLVGILHETGSKKLVILCHGFRSSKESKTLTCLTNALTTENISVFRFDFAGNGESEGTFQYGNYRREVDDLRAVVQYFTDQMWELCAIAGHSKGGNVVLLYASMYRDIPKVVNISGRFDLRVGIEDRLGKGFMERVRKEGFIDVKDKSGKVIYRVTEESLMDRLSTDMRAACQTIDKNCSVLTIHGSQDDIVPSGDALEIAKYTSNHKLHIIEGADHGYLSHQLQLSKLLVEFVAFDSGPAKDNSK